MSDLISRQAALYAIYGICNEPVAWLIRAAREIEKLPSAQPEERTEERTETHACDCISRQAAVDAFPEKCMAWDTYDGYIAPHVIRRILSELPSAQPEIKPISYVDCANAMLKMWMDNVLTYGEYKRIMDKLNEFEVERRTDEGET